MLMLRSYSCLLFLFFFYCSTAHRDLHSFPTRRSSDLMLWFVSLAAARKLIVNRYVDDAEGVLEKNSEGRSEEHTSELQSPDHLVCRLLLEKKKELTEVLLLMCFLAHRRSTRGYTTYSS